MHIQPLQDRILVRRTETDETTPGGLIIPDAAKEKPQEGKVVAVGPGRMIETGHIIEVAVKVGDTVMFSKYGGTEVIVEEQEHLIIREDDILGIVTE